MRTYLYIGAGGFAGAVLRFFLKNCQLFSINSTFPLSVLIINITGCFALGFFLRLAFDVWEVDPDMRLGISTGLIGAFTTFSTFCRDIVSLLLTGHVSTAAAYLSLSVAAGLIAVYFGDLGGKCLIDAVHGSGRE